jgi:uncharacterized protein (DUF983 family)
MTDHQRLKLFLRRAMHLRCPECGVSPLFVPLKRTRSFDDLIMTLDGCPRCGYAYTRENGYWLIATWVINYTIVAGLGLVLGLLIDWWWHPPLWKMFLWIFIPLPLLSLALARHAKAVFLAIDHYCDPHRPKSVNP